MTQTVPENLYKGELVSYPGPWAFQLGRAGIILVADQELETLANDPDKKINLTMTFEKQEDSLRGVCEKAKARGDRTLIVAFDHFFAQYRPGQAGPRQLMPDQDKYIQLMAKISAFAQQYGLGLELSILNPLEIGPGYRAATGESGVWLHYRKGLRDPKTGAFSVELWQQQRWSNNKGPINIDDAGVRVFAFHERRIGGTPYYVVNPDSIVEISDVAKVEVFDGIRADAGDYRARRIRVYGTGHGDIGPLDRVLVVQQYKTPEMDYFSDKAYPFLKTMLDKYAKAGVRLNGLYSDEMHIQQDWGYFSHHDNGEFALRYVSPGLEKVYAQRYGAQYKDLAKYMLYFVYGQDDMLNTVNAKDGTMYVFGDTPEAIQQTALFRARYYHLLQDGVVDLCARAKHHAEELMGHKLEARAHATWAESPTCDVWNSGQLPHAAQMYEYTPNFVWSNTVQQTAAACSDYFKWGDYLTGNGNDDSEGGWLDRDYFGLAMGCSTGILNEVPFSYAAHWGSPAPVANRHQAAEATFGTASSPLYNMVEGMQHRDVSVLMLYPLDLVAEEERFGSWMTQYGYANYVTPDKLLERGKVEGGAIEMAGRRFTTLVALFEPFPSQALLAMMKQLAENGGRVIWAGPPPLLTAEGQPALATWEAIFGVTYKPEVNEGQMAPGRQVFFAGPLQGVVPQVILTDFLVDHIYPVTAQAGTQPAATVQGALVGTVRTLPGGGTATFLGFRPRDDQSASLGYETRQWFEILDKLGAYPPTGKFKGVNDNTEYLSRTTDDLVCRFPNGTVALCPHYKSITEDWDGGFARNAEHDKEVMAHLQMPPSAIKLDHSKVDGHEVTYAGDHAVAFRVDAQGNLIGFAGAQCQAIAVDGKTTTFADRPVAEIAWAPVEPNRRVEGGALVQLIVRATTGTLRIPLAGLPLTHPAAGLELIQQGATPGSRGPLIPCRVDEGALTFDATPGTNGAWLYVVEKK